MISIMKNYSKKEKKKRNTIGNMILKQRCKTQRLSPGNMWSVLKTIVRGAYDIIKVLSSYDASYVHHFVC